MSFRTHQTVCTVENTPKKHTTKGCFVSYLIHSQLRGLRCQDARKVTYIEYLYLSVWSDENVLFTNKKLQNEGDMRTMFSIFSYCSMKGPIELDAELVKSIPHICLSLIVPKNFELGDDKVVNLSYLKSRLCYIYVFNFWSSSHCTMLLFYQIFK
jgi:hypothetical protein